jgi:hypothetical protein
MTTSALAIPYNPDGTVLFSGTINFLRKPYGDNDDRSVVVDALDYLKAASKRDPSCRHTPFGRV